MKSIKPYFFLIIIAVITSFYFFGGDDLLTLSFVKAKLAILQTSYKNNPLKVIVLFMALYVSITGLSIPGSIVLTLLSGAIFGAVPGTLIVNLSSTLGALVAFILARYLLKDFVHRRFERQYCSLNRNIEKDGWLYLLTLRLIPISPFVVINMATGLTNMRMWPYIWITFLGMLPGTFIYVYAGKKILEIQKISDIMTPSILISLTLLGIFPYAAKRVFVLIRRRHRMKTNYDLSGHKPRQSRRNEHCRTSHPRAEGHGQ
jgi:uncharacterized membrane protein YdjX (TVP38/TMEM64 family)